MFSLLFLRQFVPWSKRFDGARLGVIGCSNTNFFDMFQKLDIQYKSMRILKFSQQQHAPTAPQLPTTKLMTAAVLHRVRNKRDKFFDCCCLQMIVKEELWRNSSSTMIGSSSLGTPSTNPWISFIALSNKGISEQAI